MTISFYLDYIKRCNTEIKKLSQKEQYSYFYFWYDFVKASVVHGCILNHYCRGGLHKLKGCERRKSMTYRRILDVYKKCNDPKVQHLLENKVDFNRHFKDVVKRDWLYSKEMSFEQFSSLCKKNDYLIIKPFDGVNGQDIRKIQTPKDSDIRKAFNEYSRGAFLIEECIKQHVKLNFGSSSVNTIRAFSLIDRHGNIHILKQLLRVGVGNSTTDNYSTGGCVYEVDPQTGIVVTPSLTKAEKQYYIHPGTDICMLGYQLPNWDKVIDAIKVAHRLIPQNRFVGWDIAITDNGVEFIEGNHNPGYELLEFFGTKGWFDKIKDLI